MIYWKHLRAINCLQKYLILTTSLPACFHVLPACDDQTGADGNNHELLTGTSYLVISFTSPSRSICNRAKSLPKGLPRILDSCMLLKSQSWRSWIPNPENSWNLKSWRSCKNLKFLKVVGMYVIQGNILLD